MVVVKVCEDIFWVGVDDKRDILFEGLWPIPYGVSYNSYIVKGSEKIALIDAVDRFYTKEFLSNIEEVVKFSEIDYIILNHLEPDHSGALEEVVKKTTKAKIVSSQMGINFAKAYYGGNFEAIAVKDNDTLNLGGHTLKFITAPWLHWPETIFTYDINTSTLFSGDAFGTFGALEGKIFDDETNVREYENEMKRYFADIVSHYSQFVLKAAEKIKDLPIKILCTTHGPVYRKEPDYPIKLYLKWSSGVDEKKVLIVYGSMYEHTTEIAEYLEEKLKQKGITVKSFNLCKVHPSFILPELIDSKTVLLGSPTYEGAIYPPVSNFLEYVRIKNVRPKTFGIFVNYTWGSNIIEQLKNKLNENGMKIIEPTLFVRGKLTEEDKKKADSLIENIIKIII
ncbi:MAG: FprA family A-type flavoprotein [Nitrososphaeria archaeon]|nr:FprA family A-type flavoprotein [Nitrososphaeria archaeon]